MQAGGALDGRLFAFVDETAVAALPESLAVLLEHGVFLQVLDHGLVALLVSLFGHRDVAVHGSDFGKSLLGGHFGKMRVILGPLFVFTGSGSAQIVERFANHTGGERAGNFDHTAFEILEHALGVFLLLVGSCSEDGSNLFVAFFLGGTGKVGVAHAGL